MQQPSANLASWSCMSLTAPAVQGNLEWLLQVRSLPSLRKMALRATTQAQQHANNCSTETFVLRPLLQCFQHLQYRCFRHSGSAAGATCMISTAEVTRSSSRCITATANAAVAAVAPWAPPAAATAAALVVFTATAIALQGATALCPVSKKTPGLPFARKEGDNNIQLAAACTSKVLHDVARDVDTPEPGTPQALLLFCPFCLNTRLG
jgi:hypothetical protein